MPNDFNKNKLVFNSKYDGVISISEDQWNILNCSNYAPFKNFVIVITLLKICFVLTF